VQSRAPIDPHFLPASIAGRSITIPKTEESRRMNDDARTINGYTALLTSIGAGTVAVIHDALDELAEGRVVEHLRDRPSPLQSAPSTAAPSWHDLTPATCTLLQLCGVSARRRFVMLTIRNFLVFGDTGALVIPARSSYGANHSHPRPRIRGRLSQTRGLISSSVGACDPGPSAGVVRDDS
jgi:hypothetical protein